MISEIGLPKSLSLDEKRDLLASLLRTELQRTPPLEQAAGRVDEQLDRHRQQFPALANKSYFNFGAHGPLPRQAIDAIHSSYEYMQQWGPFSTEINEWAQQEVNRTIACFATHLGVSTETIALTENCTAGCNIVLWGIRWQKGDHILLSDCENPGIVAVVEEVARRFGLETSTCSLLGTEDQASALAEVAKGLRQNTRLVVLSHVLWNTGQVLPLREIVDLCKSNGTRLLIDGAQSVGVLPLNLAKSGVDSYAFTSHKWLCGPEGVGGLFVSREMLEDLQPAFVGWRSVNIRKTDGAFSWQPGARRFHQSTSAYPLLAGMRSALAVHDDFESAEKRYQRIVELSLYLWEKLKRASDDEQTAAIQCLQTSSPETGIVVVRLNGHDHQKAVYFLEAENCFARSMYDPLSLRFSLHYFTTFAELDRLVELLQTYLSKSATLAWRT